MMMQKTRCESAATQGLRSDTIQANKMAASACEQLPHPSLPLACWLWTSPLKTSLAPKDPLKFSENIGFSKNNFWQVCCLHEESMIHWLLTSHFQIAPLSHRLHTPWSPIHSETNWGLSVSQSGAADVLLVDVGLQLPYLAIEAARSGKWAALPGARSCRRRYGALRWLCRSKHTPRAHVCCACITGATTYTECPASSVMRWDASIWFDFVFKSTYHTSLTCWSFLILVIPWQLTNHNRYIYKSQFQCDCTVKAKTSYFDSNS